MEATGETRPLFQKIGSEGHLSTFILPVPGKTEAKPIIGTEANS